MTVRSAARSLDVPVVVVVVVVFEFVADVTTVGVALRIKQRNKAISNPSSLIIDFTTSR